MRNRAKAAGAIQSRYRKYRSAGSSDQRQLSSILRSHRKANPYQIVPSSGRSVTFWRKAELSVKINQANGFGLGSNSLNFGFSLVAVIGYLAGLFAYGPGIPNYQEFQALFDYYMINAVKMQIFFTKNTDPVSSTTGLSHGMPLLMICNDFDDIAENMTLNAMNERVGCRHIQFDSNNMHGITHYIKSKPSGCTVSSDT